MLYDLCVYIFSGVTCSYLVGSFLMLIVIIMFIPFGLLYTNGCQYLNDGVENIEVSFPSNSNWQILGIYVVTSLYFPY
jgi:hypothetical protein